MSAFLLATINVKDPAKLQEYLGKVQQLGVNYGAKRLAKGKAVRAINGEAVQQDMAIVVEFPDTERLHSLFDSDEYQELIPIREAGKSMVLSSHQMLE